MAGVVDAPATWLDLLRACRGAKLMTDRITGRRHVGEPDSAVVAYTLSRLNPDCPEWYRRVVERMARLSHHQHRKLYRFVMGGGHGYTGRNA